VKSAVFETRSMAMRVAEIAGPILERALRDDSCLNATRVLLEVFRKLGVRARPLSVRAMALNAKFLEGLGKPGDPVENTPGAWGVGIETRPGVGSPTGWAGHLVTLVENHILVDGSARQFTRPHVDIVLPSVLVGEWSKKGRAYYDLAHGGVIEYRARPRDLSFQAQPGFRPHEENLKLAQEIYEKI
jgi:hypothetical protein